MDVSSSDMVPPETAVEATPRAGAVTGPSWQDQDGVLREMWLQNQTPQQIAEALNRSVPAIMTRAARLGLPRRSAPGRKPGRRMIDATGAVTTARAAAPRTPMQEARTAPQTSLRVCLMCLNKFESLGRHNRICPGCKGSAEYDSASSLPELHIPSS